MTGRWIKVPNEQPKYKHIKGPRPVIISGKPGSDTLVIVEGMPDHISITQAGYACMALLGTGSNDEHIRACNPYKRVVICMDGDDAGRKAIQKIADQLGDKVRIVVLPEGMNPCEFLKSHGADVFRKHLDEAKDPICYRIDAVPADTSRLQLRENIEPALKAIARTDEPRIEAYLNEVLVPRFTLKHYEIVAYRRLIKAYKEESAAALDRESHHKQFLPVEI